MLGTFAAAGLVAALALAGSAAFAQTDASGAAMPAKAMADKPMSDKTMAPKKAMTMHHATTKKAMTKSMTHPDAMKGGDMKQKM